jgi:hypothetical protein
MAPRHVIARRCLASDSRCLLARAARSRDWSRRASTGAAHLPENGGQPPALWRFDRGDYGWLTPQLAPIYKDFCRKISLRRLCAGVGNTVLVQAAPTVEETRFLPDWHTSIHSSRGRGLGG